MDSLISFPSLKIEPMAAQIVNLALIEFAQGHLSLEKSRSNLVDLFERHKYSFTYSELDFADRLVSRALEMFDELIDKNEIIHAD